MSPATVKATEHLNFRQGTLRLDVRHITKKKKKKSPVPVEECMKIRLAFES